MIPYEEFPFFLYLLIPLVPAVILGLIGVSGRVRSAWVLLSTLGMLVLVMQPLNVLVQVLGFYGFSWIAIRAYLAYRQSKESENQVWVFYLAVFVSILPLGLVKLNPVLAAAGLFSSPLGFLGISYLTFRAVGTVIEIRDGLIKELSFFNFLSYMLFFPTLAAGPIDRYRRFQADLSKILKPRDYARLAVTGVDYIFRGLLYKFIIAYLINRHGLAPFEQAYGFIPTLRYMYAYSFYLFFDFAGYSSFAIGVSLLLGIETPENFNRPFLSKNIKDFWNRWHMSLSFWFRDYIYMRFVLDSAKKKRFKNRYTSAYIGYLLLFGIMGIWHGTQLQYIVYGFYHAGLMIGFDFLQRQNKKYKFWGQGPIWDGLAVIVTIHFVMLGFLIFSGRLF